MFVFGSLRRTLRAATPLQSTKVMRKSRLSSRVSSSRLEAKKDDNDNKDNKINELWESYNERLDNFLEKCKEFAKELQTKLNLPSSFMENMPDWLLKLRERLTWGFFSFIASVSRK